MPKKKQNKKNEHKINKNKTKEEIKTNKQTNTK
jgi:hypothetical protein